MEIQVNPSEYKLLIVDDVPTNVMLLQNQLSKERYTIVTANSGKEALAIIDREKPDLLLLDIMMPVMDGFEVARIVKSSPDTRHIPIIFISALNGSQDIVKGFHVGASDFVSKPFNKEELIIRVSHQISRVAARRIIEQQKETLHDIVREQNILFSVIARDIHFPLDSVANALERIENQLRATDGTSPQALVSARETTQRILNLLDDLFERARFQTGKFSAIRTPIDLNQTINDTLSIFDTALSLDNIRLHTDTTSPVEAFADAGMIRLVVRHLLANAIRHSEPNDEITVSVENDDDRAFVRIADKGSGITEQERLRIERILASDVPADIPEEQSGLSVCRNFVEQNGGTLWFESGARGAAFVFSVPRKE